MNGAQKRTKHIWKGLRGKKYRYLTIAILCVSLIMAASMLMLYLGGQKDERRYQSESYEMLEQNTTDFNKIFGRADGFVRNLTASLGSLDWFASASQEEIDACFPAYIADAGIQWIRDVKSIDSPVGREFYNRIGVVLSSSVDFDRLILYAPTPASPSVRSAAANTSFSPETKKSSSAFLTRMCAGRPRRAAVLSLFPARPRKSTSCCISSSIWKTA